MSATILHVDGLVKRFGGLAATDGATLDVRAGEVHALIGPNGAGKTTLIHQIAGSLAPDAGRIVFDGADVTALPMAKRVHAGLARSYQITNVFGRLPVLDNLALAVQARSGGSLRFWRPARSERARYDEAAAVAERVGLAAKLGRLANELSHGEQRQLEVGLALATNPKLLLLDEPMAGMGPDETARLLALLQSLRGGLTLVLVEHDMDVVFQLADRISTLVSGRVIACGTPDEIRAHPDVRRAYLGDEIA
ncbi:ABC transporter ATP-binding protein [Piscinibacter gummiphilus]|uniref:ABC transporter ATP-binding protein n=1 Tax=Piscinibacter gummiphilus TaxID=946333 RepID=A0A1W6L3H7_9BURK|nr:ABC transporter ATP-binding protein [Piscinibacter gummiphilus]ARN18787.1 ABC transporter ATP-binding protein [Piscinibacter gummiphilus]ATU63429.1 ABC transporter ATP-binding protein [Piscinibacter gummiphilus]GLS95942.1 ABC transporter ATP-binding protein [Piscinibacter gummiphilus]